MKTESPVLPDEDAATERSAAIQPLIDMLDYAMIGGAELKLPKFVFLLRAASEELTNSLEQAADEDMASPATVPGAAHREPPPGRS